MEGIEMKVIQNKKQKKAVEKIRIRTYVFRKKAVTNKMR